MTKNDKAIILFVAANSWKISKLNFAFNKSINKSCWKKTCDLSKNVGKASLAWWYCWRHNDAQQRAELKAIASKADVTSPLIGKTITIYSADTPSRIMELMLLFARLGAKNSYGVLEESNAFIISCVANSIYLQSYSKGKYGRRYDILTADWADRCREANCFLNP